MKLINGEIKQPTKWEINQTHIYVSPSNWKCLSYLFIYLDTFCCNCCCHTWYSHLQWKKIFWWQTTRNKKQIMKTKRNKWIDGKEFQIKIHKDITYILMYVFVYMCDYLQKHILIGIHKLFVTINWIVAYSYIHRLFNVVALIHRRWCLERTTRKTSFFPLIPNPTAAVNSNFLKA